MQKTNTQGRKINSFYGIEHLSLFAGPRCLHRICLNPILHFRYQHSLE